ncbi:MAG: efflux RND transporter periplasmic adaptor subunit [Gammaproteobacteria bacterium]|nr:efflux RND transporter periplasmic adaptor subunit [Gammaproteobacteria bacterium]
MKKIAISAVFLIISAVLIYYIPTFSSNMPPDEDLPQVVTVSASFKDIKQKVKGRGKIISAQSSEIWVEDITDIKTIHVKQGEKIKKGQPLVTLKDHKIKKEKNSATMDMITAEYKLQELERGEESESIVTANREMTLAKIEYEKQQKESEVSKELFNAKAISFKHYEEATIQLKKAELRYTGEQANLHRLRDKQVVDVKVARLTYEKAKIIYDELAEKERDLVKRAEFDGKVIKLRKKINNPSSGEKEALMSIANPEKMQVKLQIDTYDIARVSVGQTVEIYLEEYGQVLTGRVNDIGMEVIKKQAVFGGDSPNIIEVTANIIGSKPSNLKLGTEAEAEIIVAESKNKLVLPIESILEESGNAFVYNDNQGIAKKIYVQTGLSDTEYVEIVHGISVDDRVITTGNIGIKNGSRIIAVAEPSPDQNFTVHDDPEIFTASENAMFKKFGDAFNHQGDISGQSAKGDGSSFSINIINPEDFPDFNDAEGDFAAFPEIPSD